MAASNSTAGAVLRRLAIGGATAVLGALLFSAQPAAATAAGHGHSARAGAHQHQSDQDKQAAAKRAAERAAKQAVERAKQAQAKLAQAKRAQVEQAKRAKAAHTKAGRAAAHKQTQQAAAAAQQANQAAVKAQAAVDKAQAAVDKAQAAVDKAQAAADKAQAAATKALRKAGLLPGDGNSDSRNGNKSGGDQPVTPASTGKGVPTGHHQQAPASKASSAELAATAVRQAAAVGSVFVNSAPASNQPAPASKPVQQLAAAKHVQPRTTLAAPPLRVIQVQTPIQLAEAGLSLGAGPLVLLGLVVVGGLITVIAGTRRRYSGQHN